MSDPGPLQPPAPAPPKDRMFKNLFKGQCQGWVGIRSFSKKAPARLIRYITQRQTKTENLQRYRPRAASLSFLEPEAGVETVFLIYLAPSI